MAYPQRSSPAINTSSTPSARGAHTRQCTAPSPRPKAPQRGIPPCSIFCPSCETQGVMSVLSQGSEQLLCHNPGGSGIHAIAIVQQIMQAPDGEHTNPECLSRIGGITYV